MKEEICQQRCTVGAHGYTNNLPENRASKTDVCKYRLEVGKIKFLKNLKNIMYTPLGILVMKI